MDTEWLWRIGEKILAGLGVVAAAVTSVIYKRYAADRSMLLRHEEHVRTSEEELGLAKSFREVCGRGPYGDTLVKALDELKAEDVRTNKRVSGQRKAFEEYSRKIASIETDLKWVREALERLESKWT